MEVSDPHPNSNKPQQFQNSMGDRTELSTSRDDLLAMSDIPRDLQEATGVNVEMLYSDEELLDFSSDHTRLVLDSMSDDEMINIEAHTRRDDTSGTNYDENRVPLTRCQKCIHHVNNHVGLLYAFISCFFFATSNMGIKLLTEKIHPAEILFWRNTFTLLWVIPPVIYVRPPLLPTKKEFLLLWCRSIAGSIAIGLVYKAFQMISVGDASAIFFSNPLLTGLLGCIFLREGCVIWDALLSTLSVLGVFLITRPPFIFGETNADTGMSDKSQMIGTMTALGAAVFAAIAFLSLRKLGGGVHFLTTLFYFSIFSIFFTTILATSFQWWTLPRCGKDRLILLSMGTLSFFGQMFLTKAFQSEKAAYVAMVRTNDVTVAFFLQYIIIGTVPLWTSLIGALLIVSASIGISVKKWVASKKDTNNHSNTLQEPHVHALSNTDSNVNQTPASQTEEYSNVMARTDFESEKI